MFRNDLRYALRQMMRTPLLTFTVVLTLTLGIGIVTTGGSSVYGMLLRPLPFAQDQATLVALYESQPKLGKTWKGISVPDMRDWQRENRVFEGIAPFARTAYDVGGTERPERVQAAAVSPNFFRILGIRPTRGRAFVDGEDLAGRNRVVVISDRLWERRFHRDPKVLDRSLDVDGVAYRIVGVVGRRVEYPEWVEMYTPLVLDPDSPRLHHWLNAVARLKPGRTIAQAQADLDRVARDLEKRYPDTNDGWGAFVRPIKESVLPTAAQLGIWALLGADVLVLLLVCTNVATLLLARANSRRPEMAMRAVLGASRRRLFTQVLVESLLLSVAGGIGGVLAASWGVDLMVRIVPFEIPHWIDLGLAPQVLVFAAVVSLGAGIIFGMAPAWQLSTAGTAIAQRGDSGNAPPARTRLRSVLLVAQFAQSLVLLVAAVLLTMSAVRAAGVYPGFEPRHVMTMKASLHGSRYSDAQKRAVVIDEAIRQMARVPGVQGAAATTTLPASFEGFEGAFFESDDHRGDDRFTVYGSINGTTADYTSVLALPLLQGRLFRPEEVRRADNVALVSRSLAARLWPGADPLGRRLRKSGDAAEPWFQVVGVVGDVTPPYEMKGIDSWPDASAYVPITTRPLAALEPTFLARTPGDPLSIAGGLRAAIEQTAADVPIFDILTMKQVLRKVIWVPVYWSQLFGGVAVLALIIATVGVYAYTAYTVTSRAHEFGVRVALGAVPGRVVRMVLGRVVVLAALGALTGLPLAWLLSGALTPMLDAVSPTDKSVYTGVTLFLFAILIVAAWLPARRAALADPSETLKSY